MEIKSKIFLNQGLGVGWGKGCFMSYPTRHTLALVEIMFIPGSLVWGRQNFWGGNRDDSKQSHDSLPWCLRKAKTRVWISCWEIIWVLGCLSGRVRSECSRQCPKNGRKACNLTFPKQIMGKEEGTMMNGVSDPHTCEWWKKNIKGAIALILWQGKKRVVAFAADKKKLKKNIHS